MATQEQVAAAGEEALSAAARQEEMAAEVGRLQQVIRAMASTARCWCEQVAKVST